MSWLRTTEPKKYEVLFLCSSGKEYKLTLTQMNLVEDIPPSFIREVGEFVQIGFDGLLFSDIYEFANLFGCVVSGFEEMLESN